VRPRWSLAWGLTWAEAARAALGCSPGAGRSGDTAARQPVGQLAQPGEILPLPVPPYKPIAELIDQLNR
jgi:hypothetical protein